MSLYLLVSCGNPCILQYCGEVLSVYGIFNGSQNLASLFLSNLYSVDKTVSGSYLDISPKLSCIALSSRMIANMLEHIKCQLVDFRNKLC